MENPLFNLTFLVIYNIPEFTYLYISSFNICLSRFGNRDKATKGIVITIIKIILVVFIDGSEIPSRLSLKPTTGHIIYLCLFPELSCPSILSTSKDCSPPNLFSWSIKPDTFRKIDYGIILLQKIELRIIPGFS